MKIRTTLALLLLAGCASNGQGIADSIAAVTKPLLTVDTPSEDPLADSEDLSAEQTQAVTTSEEKEPSDAECEKVKNIMDISVAYTQELCAKKRNKQLAEKNKVLIESATVRNPPSITELGMANPEEGQTKIISDDKSALRVSRIIDRYTELDRTGFSLDYQPLDTTEVFRMEFRLITSEQCNGNPGMEQTVWTNIKSGKPEIGRVHCFQGSKTTFINMSQGMLSANEARAFSIEGIIKDGKPWIHVFQSNINRIY